MKVCSGCGWQHKKSKTDGGYLCGPCRKEYQAHECAQRAAALLRDASAERQRRALQVNGMTPQQATNAQRAARARRLDRMTGRG